LIINSEETRTTSRTEAAAVELGCFSRVSKLANGPYSIERKCRAAFFSAVSAMTDADSERFASY
jgi:hypothetical protein